MAKTTIPVFKPSEYYPLGTTVRKISAGFNSQDVLGTVIAHDFFGAAQVQWEQQETFL